MMDGRGRQDLAGGLKSLTRGLGGAGQRVLLYLSLMQIQSDLPIDVLIPAAQKDLDVLPYSIDGVRRNIRHPILNFYVVAPESKPIRDLCARKGCTFVHERELVDLDYREFNLVMNGVDRSSWIYQQFLKWSGTSMTGTPYYLVVDADTVFVRPQVFERSDRIIFNYSDEYHEPYFEMYRRLLTEPVSFPSSFTSHQMLIDRRILRELKGRIEAIHGCGWQEAILRNLDRSEPSAFSDYDTYGHYVFLHHPKSMAIEYWFNLSVTRKVLRSVRLLEIQYGGTYKSMSFHSYGAK
jgi:hypothetical protein